MAKYNWWQWSSVADGNTKPGSPVTVLRDGERFALFVADKSGSIYNIAGTPGDWGDWASVSQGQTTPGGWVEAGWDGQAFQLFLADPGGGVYTIRGTPDQGWGLWSSVSQGSTRPGAPIAVGWDGQAFQLFLADPGGGVYTARGTAAQGWGPWSSVSQGSTTPGAPVTAVWDGQAFQLFLADPSGGVYTARGTATQGWGPWTWVSQGRTTPGGQVTAVWDGKQFAVIVADPGGEVFAAFGTIATGWTPWSSVAQGSTIPGGPVTALLNYNSTQMALFLSDPNGGVYTIGTRQPDAPSNLQLVSVTDSTINIAWTDDSADFDGFRVLYELAVAGAKTAILTLPPVARTATIGGLQSNTSYDVNVVAFNDVTGESPNSNGVLAVTFPAPQQPASITAAVTNLGANFGLLIRGSNFGKGEQVAITVDWTVGSDPTEAFPLAANTDSVLGAFQTTFTGVVPSGFCPISVPFGDPQPPQKFQVRATGSTSGKTASATAGPFTCP